MLRIEVVSDPNIGLFRASAAAVFKCAGGDLVERLPTDCAIFAFSSAIPSIAVVFGLFCSRYDS